MDCRKLHSQAGIVKLSLGFRFLKVTKILLFICGWIFEVLLVGKGSNLAEISQNLGLQRLQLLNKLLITKNTSDNKFPLSKVLCISLVVGNGDDRITDLVNLPRLYLFNRQSYHTYYSHPAMAVSGVHITPPSLS